MVSPFEYLSTHSRSHIWSRKRIGLQILISASVIIFCANRKGNSQRPRLCAIPVSNASQSHRPTTHNSKHQKLYPVCLAYKHPETTQTSLEMPFHYQSPQSECMRGIPAPQDTIQLWYEFVRCVGQDVLSRPSDQSGAQSCLTGSEDIYMQCEDQLATRA